MASIAPRAVSAVSLGTSPSSSCMHASMAAAAALICGAKKRPERSSMLSGFGALSAAPTSVAGAQQQRTLSSVLRRGQQGPATQRAEVRRGTRGEEGAK